MKNSKKGVTLVTCAQAMVVIFLMFMVMSTFVFTNTISLRRKDAFTKAKATATQIYYDMDSSASVSAFVTKCIDSRGYYLDKNQTGRCELVQNENSYVLVITFSNSSLYTAISNSNGDTLKFQLKSNSGKTIVLEADYVYTSGSYHLNSWQLNI